MRESEQAKLFAKAITLFETGNSQEGADILFELAKEGHLQAIEQLAYIFLDQRELDVVKELLTLFADQENETILYLKAKAIEVEKGFNYQAYLKAAHAGSASAALVLFEYHLPHDKDVAKVWFELAEKWGHPNINHFANLLEGARSSFIPEDLNDLDQWSAEFEENFDSEALKALLSRANEIEASTLRDLIGEDILSVEFLVDLILQLLDGLEGTSRKLEFLQCGMSTWRKWEETSFDGFQLEFLLLMEKTIDVVADWNLSKKELSNEFCKLVDQDFMWRDPLVLAAMVALKPISSKDMDYCAEKFLEMWDEDKSLIEDNTLDLMEDDLWDLSPLIALISLKGDLSNATLDSLLEIVRYTDCDEFSLAYWEYISACIGKGDDDCYWAPHVIWRDGFFRDIFRKGFSIDEKAKLRVLTYFSNNVEAFDLENTFGERTIQKQVMKIISSDPKMDSEVIQHAKTFLQGQD